MIIFNKYKTNSVLQSLVVSHTTTQTVHAAAVVWFDHGAPHVVHPVWNCQAEDQSEFTAERAIDQNSRASLSCLVDGVNLKQCTRFHSHNGDPPSYSNGDPFLFARFEHKLSTLYLNVGLGPGLVVGGLSNIAGASTL